MVKGVTTAFSHHCIWAHNLWILFNRIKHGFSSFLIGNRSISTPRLNTLLRLHLEPINLIISQGSQMIPYLEVGFPLRCFQRLSIPNIATLRCSWQNSRYTRGQFTPVLSSRYSPISRSADYIFTLL